MYLQAFRGATRSPSERRVLCLTLWVQSLDRAVHCMKCLELRLPNLLPSQFVSNIQNLACVVIHHVLVFWLAMSSYFGSRSTYARRLYDCCLFLRFLFFFFWSHHVCPHYIIDRVNCQERHRDRQSATPQNVFTYRSTQFAPTQTQSFRPTA